MSQPLETSDRNHKTVAHHHHFPSKSNILLQMVCLPERHKPEFPCLSKPRFPYPEHPFLHLLFFLRILHLSHPSFLHSMIFSYKIQNIKPVNSIRDVCSLPSCSPFFLKSKSFSRSVMSNSLPPWTVAHQSPLSVEFSRQ